MNHLLEHVDAQRKGWSLTQPFYLEDDVFEAERRHYFPNHWFAVAHASELPKPRDHLVRSLAGESIIVVRGEDGVVRAFHNVCRHRGSRICDGDGRGASLICPYHSWSFKLDGSLRAAPGLPADIDKADLGLRPVAVKDIGGIILASLNGDPAQLDGVAAEADPVLDYHGIAQARIAARKSYPTRANWKLVLENFFECYHCPTGHAEYCSVMDHVSVLGRIATPDVAGRWNDSVSDWLENRANKGFPLAGVEARGIEDVMRGNVTRWPIGEGKLSASRDGRPVAPLMGKQHAFDGGATSFRLDPFVYLAAYNDHARLIQFLPVGADDTDVVITWLVDGQVDDSDVDVERMMWLWDVTTIQDKQLIERNAAGIRSSAYLPGPYTTLEQVTSGFIATYLDDFREAITVR